MNEVMMLTGTEREQAIRQYIRALDLGEIEEISRVLTLAERDTELDRLITEVHVAYEEELWVVDQSDEQVVHTALKKHFGDALDEGPKKRFGLTVGDVAVRLERDRQIPSQDVTTNHKLISSTLSLPENLAINSIRQLAQRLEVSASDRYWRAFRNTAITMQMGTKQEVNSELAAAREQKTNRKGKEPK